MFENGSDQAAGLRAASQRHEAVMMAVASPAQPARAYEMLCHLAMGLKQLGRLPVIIDGTAAEAGERRENDGSHLGLQHALTDASISGLGHAGDGHEWLVMPGATGLRTLQQTALAAGGAVALSRLLGAIVDAGHLGQIHRAASAHGHDQIGHIVAVFKKIAREHLHLLVVLHAATSR